MTDKPGFPEPPNFVMPRAQYMEHLQELILALVDRYGEMTVQTVHERCNQAIMMYGIAAAADRVRQGG